MSEPMDLDLQKAAQCWCDPRTGKTVMIPELATVFAEMLASERRRLIERFRPVVEAGEAIANDLGIHPKAWKNNCPCKNCQDQNYEVRTTEMDLENEKIINFIKALALFKELEKENGQ